MLILKYSITLILTLKYSITSILILKYNKILKQNLCHCRL